MSYQVKLEVFEGPLDLLLHLVRKDELDVRDIPINSVVKQYLEYLDLMRVLDIDVAGDFLVMAATLMQIKSALLLPRPKLGEGEEEGEDPRALLAERLEEYQKYKEAAHLLDQQPRLDRDFFVRSEWPDELEFPQETYLEVGLPDLLDAFRRILDRLEPGEPLAIDHDRLSIADETSRILELLEQAGHLSFTELFEGVRTRDRVIVTFLALLEMVKMSAVKVLQSRLGGDIRIFLTATTDEGEASNGHG